MKRNLLRETWGVCVVCVLLGIAGCLERQGTPLNPCIQSSVEASVRVDSVDKVDLLIVVDNSGSMAEEQASLRQEIPRIVSILTTGERDGLPGRDFEPVTDLRIGVITSDMGTGDSELCRQVGDDGVLRTAAAGSAGPAGCEASYPKFISFRPAEDGDPEAFSLSASCLASQGTSGCGFEQPLEAVLKATTPRCIGESRCVFVNGGADMPSSGHGDSRNAIGDDGFVRDDALLAVLILTDEEDCSARDPRLFEFGPPGDVPFPGTLDTQLQRCTGLPNGYPDALHPVSRYVEGLLALKSSPDLLVYALIVGVPQGLTIPNGDPAITLDSILNAEELTERVNSEPLQTGGTTIDKDNGVEPSCTSPGGLAFPPRRLVQVAQDLDRRGANSVVQSICKDDFAPAIDAILSKIVDALGGACLPRPLNPNGAGLVECTVTETLPRVGAVTRCGQLPGRTLLERTADGAEKCTVEQVMAQGLNADGAVDLSVATGPGWFYDTVTDEVKERCPEGQQQRIGFVVEARPVSGSRIELECLQPVGALGPDTVDIQSPCPVPDAKCAAGAAAPGLSGVTCVRALRCDPISNTFEVECTANSDCPTGFRCDAQRPTTEGLGPICVNPICG